jgi:signal peptidase I
MVVLTSLLDKGLSRAEAFKVPAPSMVPTFLVGDHVLADKWAYLSGEPERGDLVIFRYPRSRKTIYFLKRCVAIGGDVVEIRDRDLHVNGNKVEEPYAAFFMEGEVVEGMDNFGPFTVPDDKMFVLGDNRHNSNDSRFWGPAEISDVKAKVRIIYWSWDKNANKVRWDRIGTEFN